MGSSGSRGKNTATYSHQHSRKIDKELQKEQKNATQKVKLLLLGASESGKSTLFRQMRILHQNGFTLTERLFFRNIIIGNLIQYTVDVLNGMESLELQFGDEECQTYADRFLAYASDFEHSDYHVSEFREQLHCLYDSTGFQECIDRGQEYGLGDAAKYLFKSLDRISSMDYMPTDQDILNSRAPTTGITELKFNFKGYSLCMVDVGGQSSERRKWIHCFDDVTAIIFTVAMSFYDQTLEEAPNMNKLHESLNLFQSLCKNQFLSKSAFILFLNKKDVFQERIQKKSLRCCFPNYRGEDTYKAAATYIRERFEKAGERTAGVYPHYTNATDTNNIDRVFDTSMAIILNRTLANTGFL